MAQSWSRFMVAHDYYDHGSFTTRLSGVGYHWRSAGEDIATGYTTPREVVQAWLASQEHCWNIFDPAFRDIGIGVVPAFVPSAANMGATWTLDLGLSAGKPLPSTDTRP
jgi:uncharacterized protein YkwD